MKQLKRYLDKGIKTIGFLDIETRSNRFKAQNGNLITWVLEQYNIKSRKSITWFNKINKKDLKRNNRNRTMFYDESILDSLVEKMKECNLIVSHYGTWFDIPFIRTRCDMMNKPFITHSDKIRFSDTWKLAKLTGSYERNSLDNITETLNFKLQKTKVEYKEWHLANYGDKKSIDYILHHNFVDVKLTKRLWLKTEKYAPISARYY